MGKPVAGAATSMETRPLSAARSAIDYRPELDGCLVSTEPREDPRMLGLLAARPVSAAVRCST
jgi:hypothetical protein